MRKPRVYTSADFKEGNYLGELPKEEKTFPCGATNPIRMGLFKCLQCGKNFKAPLADALRTQRKCCSYACTHSYRHKVNLGTEEHYLYTRWLGMRQRCLNPTNHNYAKYGGRGITIDPAFDNFANYVTTVESLPTFPGKEVVIATNLQLDRIDNNKGYYKENLRWATVSTNTSNRNKYLPIKDSKATSQYIGVTYAKNRKNAKWVAQIFYNKHWVYRKGFNEEMEAVMARDNFIIANALPHKLNILSRNATTIPKGSTSKQMEAQSTLV